MIRLTARRYLLAACNIMRRMCDVNNSSKGETLLLQWLNVVEKTVNTSTSSKLILFFAFTSDLVTDNILRKSKSAHWRISNTDFYFRFEVSEPIVVFDIPFGFVSLPGKGRF